MSLGRRRGEEPQQEATAKRGKRGRPPERLGFVIDRLRQDYLRQLEPGQRLPSVRSLSLRYSVSRDTVLSAVAALERQREILTKPNSGLYASGSFGRRQRELYASQIGLSFAKTPYEMTDRFRGAVLSGIMRRQHEMGLALVLSTREWRWPDGHDPAEIFLNRSILGIYLFEQHEERLLTAFQELKKPLVALDFNATRWGIDSVCLDNVGAGKELASRLAGLGHRTVAAIFENPEKPVQKQDEAWRDRRAGFKAEWLRTARTPILEILQQIRGERESGIRHLRELLKRPGAERPTALCVPELGWWPLVRDLARELSLEIPRDLSVVGFGTLLEESELDSIRFDGRALGLKAAERMEKKVMLRTPSKKGAQLLVRIPGTFSPGGTTARVQPGPG